MQAHAAEFFIEIRLRRSSALLPHWSPGGSARGARYCSASGGSAGNCSHAVNDFRELCGIEAYSPIDNGSELSARTNDEGWHAPRSLPAITVQ